MSHEKQNLILNFWFGDNPLKPVSHRRMWFGKDEGLDAVVRSNFTDLLTAAEAGAFEDWAKTPRGALALVILLDQFPRHIYRNSDRAFSQDQHARRIAEIAIDYGFDLQLSKIERCFLYLPLEHSEDLAAQERAVELYTTLAGEVHDEQTPVIEEALDYALKHREIIAKYGRFPHRNEALGRQSTNEELEFLKRPGSSF